MTDFLLGYGKWLESQGFKFNKYSNELKETLGHSKVEVIVGSILGPLITLPGIEYLGSPLKIIDMILN